MKPRCASGGFFARVLSRRAPALLALITVALSLSAQAYEADWRRGRIYYRSVCTSCHSGTPMGFVEPSSKTQAEWSAYLQADKHARGKDTVKSFVSQAYRASIRSGNKAAEKLADTPEAELFDDVRAFLLRGAKDGEAPANCN